ncbi:MAG: hypothetical protein AAF236_07675 [Verrucomicrobiota bacterium]
MNSKLLAFILLLNLSGWTFSAGQEGPQPAALLKTAFEAERLAGAKKVSGALLEGLREQLQSEMKRGDLENSNQINTLIEQVESQLEQLEAGTIETITLLPADESTLPEVTLDLVTRHHTWLSEGLSKLRKKHLSIMLSNQTAHLANGDLAEANVIAEQIALMRAVEEESVERSKESGELVLLDDEHREKWKQEKGEWTFRASRLVGEGDSKIGFHHPLEPPFVLAWRHEVKKGQRPRVYVEDFTIQNFGYDFELTLFPKPANPQTFPYQRDRAIDVEFVVEHDFVELWIEGERLERRAATMPKTISVIFFSGGDGFSPGITEFSKVVVRPGSRKESSGL